MIPIKEEYIQPWIDGLRSGEFTQITGKLVAGKHRCCALGVLGKTSGAFMHEYLGLYPELHLYCYPDKTPYEKMTQFEDFVAKWNDLDGLTFEEIADKLEAMR